MRTILKYQDKVIIDSANRDAVIIEYFNFKLNKKIISVKSLSIYEENIDLVKIEIPNIEDFCNSLIKIEPEEFNDKVYWHKRIILNHIFKMNNVLIRNGKFKEIFKIEAYHIIKKNYFKVDSYESYLNYLDNEDFLIKVNNLSVARGVEKLRENKLYELIYNHINK